MTSTDAQHRFVVAQPPPIVPEFDGRIELLTQGPNGEHIHRYVIDGEANDGLRGCASRNRASTHGCARARERAHTQGHSAIWAICPM